MMVRQGQSGSVARVLVGRGILPLLSPHLVDAVLRWRTEVGKDEVDLSYSPLRPEFARAHDVAGVAREAQRSQSYNSRLQNRVSRYEYLVAIDKFHTLHTGSRAMFGVETRDPTLDLRLVEFCLSLPEEQQRRDGQARWLIRRAMAHRLPREVTENQ